MAIVVVIICWFVRTCCSTLKGVGGGNGGAGGIIYITGGTIGTLISGRGIPCTSGVLLFGVLLAEVFLFSWFRLVGRLFDLCLGATVRCGVLPLAILLLFI